MDWWPANAQGWPIQVRFWLKWGSSRRLFPATVRSWSLWNPVRVRLIAVVLLLPTLAFAGDSKLTEAQRTQVIRAFLAERPWVHRALPRGKAGVRIEEDGKIVPSGAEMNQLVSEFGSAAKPGDRVKITAVRFVRHGIDFEINGGPVKKKKWYDRVSVDAGGFTPHGQSGDQLYDLSNGSSVLLILRDDAGITTAHIKELLAPVLDFKSLSQAEAYQKGLPPLVAAAVKKHHALVGMDADMVLFALGRPQQRLHETTKDGQDYDEWIYGTPPQEVEFIRFIGNKVIRIEDMKVSGEKVVRTQNEVGDSGGTLDASAQKKTLPNSASAPSGAEVSGDQKRRAPPTLLRPGETAVVPNDAPRNSSPSLPADPNGPPSSTGRQAPGPTPSMDPTSRSPD